MPRTLDSCLVAAAVIFCLPMAARALNPLLTDDADTVERGRLQLNTGVGLSRTGSTGLDRDCRALRKISAHCRGRFH